MDLSHINVERLDVEAFTIPTDAPEADGTIAWNATTMVLVHARAGGITGLGYSYTDSSVSTLIRTKLAEVVIGCDAFDPERAYVAMMQSVRNVGRDGMAASAISAVDNALWDLKARLLDVPLVALLGAVREAVTLYGSGGFTSYSIPTLVEQLSGWVREGIRSVKMKIGRDPAADRLRVQAARDAIGAETQLFVDANGAYDRKVALDQAQRFATQQVSWFEEPVPSDDLEGLRLLRDRARRAWRSQPGSTGTTSSTSDGCWRPAASTCCRPTRRAAAASRDFSKPARSPTHFACRCRRIRRRASMRTSAARSRACAISNTFTTTCASNRCCSTACCVRSTGRCGRTVRGPATVWS